jgi:hypothetical protein
VSESTSTAKPAGKCGRCGGQLYEHLYHSCGTGVQLSGGTPGLWPNTPAAEPMTLGKMGWECPVCHSGCAPWMPYCDECRRKSLSSTSSVIPESESLNGGKA